MSNKVKHTNPTKKNIKINAGESHVLKFNLDMLAPQLIGRLLSELDGNDHIRSLLRQCDEQGLHQNGLVPTYHCLHTPGGPLKYSLEGHLFAVFAFRLTPDYRYIVSISNKFITWDVSTRFVR